MVLLSMLDGFHMSAFILATNSFAFILIGILIGVLITSIERGFLTVGPRTARVIVSVAILSALLSLWIIFKTWQILRRSLPDKFSTTSGDAVASAEASDSHGAAVAVGATIAAVVLRVSSDTCELTYEATHRHVCDFLRYNELFFLFLLIAWFIVLLLLNIATIVVYARIVCCNTLCFPVTSVICCNNTTNTALTCVPAAVNFASTLQEQTPLTPPPPAQASSSPQLVPNMRRPVVVTERAQPSAVFAVPQRNIPPNAQRNTTTRGASSSVRGWTLETGKRGM